MKIKSLIKLLESLPENTEVLVGAWSPQEDYDRTDNIKICRLSNIDSKNPKVIICDKNTEYWTREIK